MLEELGFRAPDAGREERGAGPVLGDARAVCGVLGRDRDPDSSLLADDFRSLAPGRRGSRRCAGGWSARTPRCAGFAEAIASPKAQLAPADKPRWFVACCRRAVGVGKTELAALVAAYLFGATDRMVRLDMSEYTIPWAAERLCGGDGEEGR